MNQQIFNELETIKKLFHYNTENILNYITEVLSSNSKLESRISDLEEEIESLQETIEDTEHYFENPAGYNRNIVSDLVLEKLFENLNSIPLESIERLTKEYTS